MSSEFLQSKWLIKYGCGHDHSDLNPKERHDRQRAAPSLRLGGTVWLRAASGDLGPRYRTDLSCSDLTTGNSLWRHQRDEQTCLNIQDFNCAAKIQYYYIASCQTTNTTGVRMQRRQDFYIPSLAGTAEENTKAHFVAEAVPLGTIHFQNVPALR